MNARNATRGVELATMGGMGLVLSAGMAALAVHREAQDRRHEESWADYWARRAAAAEKRALESLQSASFYRAEAADLADRLSHAEREISRLRRRIAVQ